MGEENCYIVRRRALLDRLGGYHCVNYEKVVTKGFLAILTEVEEEFLRAEVTRREARIQQARTQPRN